MYIHLTTHSAYSLQEGLLLPSEIAQAAKEHKMNAVGLTDHRILTGAVEFAVACKNLDIQPIFGLEIDLEFGKVSLLATSQDGWANLCRLSSVLALRNDSDVPCQLPILSKFSRDLIALPSIQTPNDDDQKLVAESRLGSLREIFPDKMFITIREAKTALKLTMFAKKLGLPTAVTNPVYYRTPEQAKLQRTLTAIRLNQTLDAVAESTAAPAGAYFLSIKEIESLYRNFPTAIEATQEIAEQCKFDLLTGKAHMPTVPVPQGITVAQYLRDKAETGAQKIYGRITPEIQSRLDHELNVIADMGFEPIFLIVEEILNFARQQNIPFSSRGSAASSLVAHCLGITSPDPLRLNLYFERFLNPARSTPPDIDTDLCSRGRDSIIEHVFDYFGADKVAMVGTINRYRPRSALGDVAKAHGLKPDKVREMIKKLPFAFWSRNAESNDGDETNSPFAELRTQYPHEKYQLIFDEAETLLNLPRHLSVHAGGLVVAPGAITDLVPVMRSGSKGITITQFDLGSVEALGLVKIDLLGIRGLTVLGDVAQFVQESQPELYATSLDVLESTPADDNETAQRIENGQTIGCFQIESPGMRATLREIHARTEDDIMAALALYRPGPLSGGLKDAFVRRFKGDEKITHLHPSLKPLLDDTFGVILYQEQVLRIAHELAGFSLAEADLLRRAMSHFDPGNRMKELEYKFISEVQVRNGIPTEIGERIWEMMAAFAGYGFPKAHAASYAKVAWRSAWCKTYFPAEFMAAVLANWGGYYSQRVYLNEARRIGLNVRPPHINFSGENFSTVRVDDNENTLAGKQLFMGLGQVRDLSKNTIEKIIRERPFHTLDQFLSKVNPRPQEADHLVRIGALIGIALIPDLLQRLQGGGWLPGQMSLFELKSLPIEDWTLDQKVAAQEEILGCNLEAHPLEFVSKIIASSGSVTTVEAMERIGQRVCVAGIRQSSHRSKTSKGDLMMFLTMEDLVGVLDVVIFPEIYNRVKASLSAITPIFITGVMEVDNDRGEPYLRCEKITLIKEP
jgi:DNA-directed DNA polymerase III PolC